MFGFVPNIPNDTATYFAAGDAIFKGSLDWLRTPVYPFICKILTILFDSGAIAAITFVQLIVFLLSVAVFKSIVFGLVKGRMARFLITALYAWNIPVISCTAYIMTESLAISCVVFYLWLVLHSKSGYKDGIARAALLFFMIMLRPFFACLLPVEIMLAFKRYYRRGSSLCVALVLIGVIAYCSAFKAQYGKFTMSMVGIMNKEGQLAKMGLKEPQRFAPHMELIYRFADGTELHGYNQQIVSALDENEMNSVIKEHFGDFLKLRVIEFVESTKMPYPAYFGVKLGRLYYHIMPPVYFTLVFVAVFCVYVLLKRRSLYNYVLGLCAFCIIAMVAVGSDGSENRLLMPALPVVILMLAAFEPIWGNKGSELT
ncbi:MAG: hypothetical protein HUJ98_03405 [Bacteroidaceae bacterium]|nr:hypothetical protein [Bacteroidaceae bacterium]